MNKYFKDLKKGDIFTYLYIKDTALIKVRDSGDSPDNLINAVGYDNRALYLIDHITELDVIRKGGTYTMRLISRVIDNRCLDCGQWKETNSPYCIACCKKRLIRERCWKNTRKDRGC